MSLNERTVYDDIIENLVDIFGINFQNLNDIKRYLKKNITKKYHVTFILTKIKECIWNELEFYQESDFVDFFKNIKIFYQIRMEFSNNKLYNYFKKKLKFFTTECNEILYKNTQIALKQNESNCVYSFNCGQKHNKMCKKCFCIKELCITHDKSGKKMCKSCNQPIIFYFTKCKCD
jgi:hypothetical protein